MLRCAAVVCGSFIDRIIHTFTAAKTRQTLGLNLSLDSLELSDESSELLWI